MYESQSAVSSQHLFPSDPKSSVPQIQEEYSPDIRLPKIHTENTLPFPGSPKPLITYLPTRRYRSESCRTTFVAGDSADIHPISQDAVCRGRTGMPLAAKTHL